MHDLDRNTIGVLFDDLQAAERVRAEVCARGGIPRTNCQLVAPGEKPGLRRAPGASRAARRSLVRWHLLLGFIGLAAGLAFAWLVHSWRPELLGSDDYVGFSIIAGLGAIFGLLAGGAVSLRPDRGLLFSALRDGVRRGKTALIVTARDSREYAQAREVLEHHDEANAAASS